ncbi:DNA-directed RNA polymerases I, II, and III subunit RPABC5-like [Ochotona curzoniae]|uniref:DNA-directed RNA polymerases I, II, and III subunit RPABC5-like n=1 Tax=Ochotona curzoniae TaxID=130825 RepID=UPI001B353BFD|nr:DNA-directed RNA polymerases I, II, and III subunit RPABC5-like [Ochotona curzoniae]
MQQIGLELETGKAGLYINQSAIHVVSRDPAEPRAGESQRATATILPVCCFTCCYKVMGNKWAPYLELLKAKYTEGDTLDTLGLKYYCCLLMLLLLVDLMKKLLNYASLEK